MAAIEAEVLSQQAPVPGAGPREWATVDRSLLLHGPNPLPSAQVAANRARIIATAAANANAPARRPVPSAVPGPGASNGGNAAPGVGEHITDEAPLFPVAPDALMHARAKRVLLLLKNECVHPPSALPGSATSYPTAPNTTSSASSGGWGASEASSSNANARGPAGPSAMELVAAHAAPALVYDSAAALSAANANSSISGSRGPGSVPGSGSGTSGDSAGASSAAASNGGIGSSDAFSSAARLDALRAQTHEQVRRSDALLAASAAAASLERAHSAARRRAAAVASAAAAGSGPLPPAAALELDLLARSRTAAPSVAGLRLTRENLATALCPPPNFTSASNPATGNVYEGAGDHGAAQAPSRGLLPSAAAAAALSAAPPRVSAFGPQNVAGALARNATGTAVAALGGGAYAQQQAQQQQRATQARAGTGGAAPASSAVTASAVAGASAAVPSLDPSAVPRSPAAAAAFWLHLLGFPSLGALHRALCRDPAAARVFHDFSAAEPEDAPSWLEIKRGRAARHLALPAAAAARAAAAAAAAGGNAAATTATTAATATARAEPNYTSHTGPGARPAALSSLPQVHTTAGPGQTASFAPSLPAAAVSSATTNNNSESDTARGGVPARPSSRAGSAEAARRARGLSGSATSGAPGSVSARGGGTPPTASGSAGSGSAGASERLGADDGGDPLAARLRGPHRVALRGWFLAAIQACLRSLQLAFERRARRLDRVAVTDQVASRLRSAAALKEELLRLLANGAMRARVIAQMAEDPAVEVGPAPAEAASRLWHRPPEVAARMKAVRKAGAERRRRRARGAADGRVRELMRALGVGPVRASDRGDGDGDGDEEDDYDDYDGDYSDEDCDDEEYDYIDDKSAHGDAASTRNKRESTSNTSGRHIVPRVGTGAYGGFGPRGTLTSSMAQPVAAITGGPNASVSVSSVQPRAPARAAFTQAFRDAVGTNNLWFLGPGVRRGAATAAREASAAATADAAAAANAAATTRATADARDTEAEGGSEDEDD